jgi:hypothetical protein
MEDKGCNNLGFMGRRATGQPINFFLFYQEKKELKIILLFSIIH